MEELQSTEVLDREILEDSRRKAQKILKAAGESAASVAKTWEKKTEEALGALRDQYRRRLEAQRTELDARLPLDKKRSRLDRIDRLLHEAKDAYLAGLGRERTLALLEEELAKRAVEAVPEFEGGGLRVRSRQLSEAEIRGLLKKVLPQGTLSSLSIETGDRLPLPGKFPALIIEGPRLRLAVSADEALEYLLRDKRAELAAALLGPGAEEAVNA
ncbi:MAG: ATPase [Treponema sp.]|jgi:vacuolar-type H+-ATPase subunit E/Vma4|nr:ATPase [Treponema sp.]